MNPITRSRSRDDTALHRGRFIHTVNGDSDEKYEHVQDFGKAEAFDDIVIPGFRERVQAGEVFINPAEYSCLTKTSDFNGVYIAVKKKPPHNVSWAYAGNGSHSRYRAETQLGATWKNILPPPADIETDLINRAKALAISRLSQAPYAFMEDLFEIRSTLSHLRGRLSDLLQLLGAMRKRVRRRSKGGRTYSWDDAWLEYRFAIMPVVRSILALAEALRDRTSGKPVRETARARDSERSKDSFTIQGGTFTFDLLTEVEAEAHAAILYADQDPFGFQFKYGLRASDIPKNLWAIAPYSFMIDRVVDISSMIQGLVNLTLKPTIQILGASVTVRKTVSQSVRVTKQDSTYYNITCDGDLYTEKAFTMSRSVWSPGIWDTLPVFDLKGLTKDAASTLDLIALIRARF